MVEFWRENSGVKMLETLPYELSGLIARDLSRPDRLNCRLVSRAWCEAVDGGWPLSLHRLADSLCSGPRPIAVRQGYDENTTPRFVYDVPKSGSEHQDARELPSYAEILRDPRAAYEAQKLAAPYYSAVVGLQRWTATHAEKVQVATDDAPVLSFGEAAAAYVRGWNEVGCLSSYSELMEDWLAYATANGPIAFDCSGQLVSSRDLSADRFLAITAPPPSFNHNAEWRENLVDTLVGQLLGDHVLRAKNISLTHGPTLVTEMAAAVALPVRALCDAMRAEGWDAEATNNFADGFRSQLISELDWKQNFRQRSRAPWQLRAMLKENPSRKLRTFLNAFDEVLAHP